MRDTTEFAIVLCTAPVDRAPELADRLLGDRWIACANLVGPMRSHYVWEGRLERADETLLVMKTRRDLVPELIRELERIHPYEVPEILEVPVHAGLPAYLAWVDRSCRQPSAGDGPPSAE